MPRDLSNKPLVCLIANPELEGFLIQQGPEQSVVRWKNGNETTVVNGWIRRVETAPAAPEQDAAPAPKPSAAAEPAPLAPVKKFKIREDWLEALRSADMTGLEAFARANEVWDDRYLKLPNEGLVRMNISNKLRAKIKKGYEVKQPTK